MRTQRVGKIIEVMSWMKECVNIKEELEWLKEREAGIECSKVCKEGLANGMTQYSNGYLSPIPPPLRSNYVEDLGKRIEDVLERRRIVGVNGI